MLQFFDSYGLKHCASGKIQNAKNSNTFVGVGFMSMGKQYRPLRYPGYTYMQNYDAEQRSTM